MKSPASTARHAALLARPLPAGSGGLHGTLNQVAMFTFLAFVLLAPLIVNAPGQPAGASGEGNALRQVVYLALLALAAASAGASRFPSILLAPPASVLLMLGWCCLSVAWAVNPAISARRLFLTLIVVWTVFLLVDTAGYERTVRTARWVLALVLLANYLAVLLAPGWAIHQAGPAEDPSIVGAWRGVLMQKNFAGAASALAVIFFVFDASKIRWPVRLLVVTAAAVFLYQTNSRTSLAIAASAGVAVGLYRLYNPYYRWVAVIYLVLGAVLAAVLANAYWSLLTAPFSSQDALTGRVQIWPVLVRYWQDHPWLGSGFGSFWNAGEPGPVARYAHGWIATAINSGHNGYLDMLAQTGLPGLVLAVFAAVLAPLSKFVMHAWPDRSRASLLLACIWFCAGHNLTESSLFDRDATVHVMLMLAIALLGLEARRR